MTFSPWEIELAWRLVCFALRRAIWKFGDGPGSQKKSISKLSSSFTVYRKREWREGEEMFGANENEERVFVGILGLLRLKTKMGYLKITRKNSSHVSNNLFVIQVSLVQAPTSRWTTTPSICFCETLGQMGSNPFPKNHASISLLLVLFPTPSQQLVPWSGRSPCSLRPKRIWPRPLSWSMKPWSGFILSGWQTSSSKLTFS